MTILLFIVPEASILSLGKHRLSLMDLSSYLLELSLPYILMFIMAMLITSKSVDQRDIKVIALKFSF